MSLTNLTKLEAVNRMLRAAREHPVSTLGAGGEGDTLMAEQVLDEVNRREQMEGLHLNTVVADFTPDANGHIILPSNTTDVRAWGDDHCRNLYFREVNGQVRLFDASETPATDIFDDEAITLRLAFLIDFEDLPLPHQFSIVDQAAVEYQMAVQGSSTIDAHLRQIAAVSRAKARAYDLRSRPHNMFSDGRASGPRLGARYVPRAWPYI